MEQDDEWAVADRRYLQRRVDAAAHAAAASDDGAGAAHGNCLFLVVLMGIPPASTPSTTTRDVIDAMGGLGETTDFYRLFMGPGVAHCRGGPGPDRFEAVAALERWVEEGVAPDRLVAAKGGQRRRAADPPALPLPAGGALPGAAAASTTRRASPASIRTEFEFARLVRLSGRRRTGVPAAAESLLKYTVFWSKTEENRLCSTLRARCQSARSSDRIEGAWCRPMLTSRACS